MALLLHTVGNFTVCEGIICISRLCLAVTKSSTSTLCIPTYCTHTSVTSCQRLYNAENIHQLYKTQYQEVQKTESVYKPANLN